jgi:hypothetical protein
MIDKKKKMRRHIPSKSLPLVRVIIAAKDDIRWLALLEWSALFGKIGIDYQRYMVVFNKKC